MEGLTKDIYLKGEDIKYFKEEIGEFPKPIR